VHADSGNQSIRTNNLIEIKEAELIAVNQTFISDCVEAISWAVHGVTHPMERKTGVMVTVNLSLK
jgi:hypothetical protein